MKNFHIKSLVLGVGIGVVLTSIISMIYLAGINPLNNLTKEQIIEAAKKYGMVENTELVKSDTEKPETKTDNQKESETVKLNIGEVNQNVSETQATKPAETANNEQTKPTEAVDIKISVNPGETSQAVADKLVRAGLISDKAVFIKELSNMGLDSEINVGEFKFKKGMNTRTIIKVLTNSK